MHWLWIDYLAAHLSLCRRSSDLMVPIGVTLPDVPIIPAERSHGKSSTKAAISRRKKIGSSTSFLHQRRSATVGPRFRPAIPS